MLINPFIYSQCKWPIASERKRHEEEILLFLAPLQTGFFRISLFIPNGICSNKAQSIQKIKLLLVVLALFSDLVQFSRTFEECFCCQSGSPGQCTWILMKNILRMFLKIRPDCRIALTPRERAWFSVYSALYLKKKKKKFIRYKSRYSKTELKIVTNSVHLVIWSRGFPTAFKLSEKSILRRVEWLSKVYEQSYPSCCYSNQIFQNLLSIGWLDFFFFFFHRNVSSIESL